MKTTRRQKNVNLLIAVLAAGLLSSCGKKDEAAPPAALPVTANTTNTPTTAAPDNAAFAKLPGKWVRPDGGYILEIRTVAPDGKMDAGYFNPNSIHVAKAEASQESGGIKVFIELRDVNYPGSTYTLIYDPASEVLKGIYYQAVQQQSFDVVFERTK